MSMVRILGVHVMAGEHVGKPKCHFRRRGHVGASGSFLFLPFRLKSGMCGVGAFCRGILCMSYVVVPVDDWFTLLSAAVCALHPVADRWSATWPFRGILLATVLEVVVLQEGELLP